MYQKVIVLELKTAYALVMEEGGRILRIRRKDGLAVGDTIYVLPEDLYEEDRASNVVPFPAGGKSRASTGKRDRKPRWLRVGGIAAMLALCITLLLPHVSPTAYAVASFDGAVSVQVALDRHGCILSAGSPDGSVQQEQLNGLKGKKLEAAAAELRTWCGDGGLLVGYALMDGDEGDPAALRTIQALFPKQPVVCLSGAAGDIRAADGQSVSLGRYLMSCMENEDLDEILEELPPETIGQLLQENPAWSRHPDLLEALEEQLEKQAEDREELPEPEERPDARPDEPEEDPEDDPPVAENETDREPDESPADPPEQEDAAAGNEAADDDDDGGDPAESRPEEETPAGEEPAEQEHGGDAGGDEGSGSEEDAEDRDEADGFAPSESETNEEHQSPESDADSDAESGE